MNVELMKALEQIEEEKGISKDVIIEAIEAALLSAYKKNYGASAQNMRIEVERSTGEMRAYQIRAVVESVDDEATQIALEEVRGGDPAAPAGGGGGPFLKGVPGPGGGTRPPHRAAHRAEERLPGPRPDRG